MYPGTLDDSVCFKVRIPSSAGASLPPRFNCVIGLVNYVYRARLVDVPSEKRRRLLGYQSRACLLRRHKHRERHVDELFVPADDLQCTPDVLCNVSCSSLFNPKRKLHNGGLKDELILVDLKK